jgi:hypothetical protein
MAGQAAPPVAEEHFQVDSHWFPATILNRLRIKASPSYGSREYFDRMIQKPVRCFDSDATKLSLDQQLFRAVSEKRLTLIPTRVLAH